MTVTKIRMDVSAVKQLLASDKEFLKPLIQAAARETLWRWPRRSARRRGSGPKPGSAISPATTHAR